MMRKMFVTTVLALAALSAACSENRGDPLSAAGGTAPPTGGEHLANAGVTGDNKLDFCMAACEQVLSSYIKAVAATAGAPSGSVRILAGNSGYGVVEGVVDTSGIDDITYFNLAITYYSYSESGELFFGGSAGCSSNWVKAGVDWVPGDITLSSTVMFSGEYKGTLEFNDFLLQIESVGGTPRIIPFEDINALVRGTVIINTAEGEIIFNPYYKPPGPGAAAMVEYAFLP